MHFFWILLCSTIVIAQTEIEDAKQSVRSLIAPLLSGQPKVPPKGTEKFRIDACEKKEINWMNVLLMKESVTLDFKFKEGCDIQGAIRPKILTPFPAVLDLRNIQSYDKIETSNKVTANLEMKPILNLEMREGVLLGPKSRVKFEADYRVRINPTGGKTVSENLGGELRISEINGKKVSIREKIKVE